MIPGIFKFHSTQYTYSMSDLTALLLDAKHEYRLQLEEIVTPTIVATFSDMWSKSFTEAGKRDGVLAFQTYLREIPTWNSTIVTTKTREIVYMYPYLDDLIAACIIAQLKIMSSIKLSQDRPKVQLKLPNTETFVHELYIQTAKRLYQDPLLLSNNTRSIDIILAPLVSDAIEKTIRKMIPFKDVLMAYLQNGGDTQVVEEALQNDSDSSGDDGSFPKRQAHVSESESSSDDDDDHEIRVGGQSPPPPVTAPEPMSSEQIQYAAPMQQQSLPANYEAPQPLPPLASMDPLPPPPLEQQQHMQHQHQIRPANQLFAGDPRPLREGF